MVELILLIFGTLGSVFILFIARQIFDSWFCLKHFRHKLCVPCTTNSCNHYVFYCPDCLDEKYNPNDKIFDRDSGCRIIRPCDDDWTNVNNMKRSKIESDMMKHKLKRIGL
jgi:hypothetical protein